MLSRGYGTLVDQATLTSRSHVPIDLEKLGPPKTYLDYINLPGLPSQPFPVILMLILAPKPNLGKLDCMRSFR